MADIQFVFSESQGPVATHTIDDHGRKLAENLAKFGSATVVVQAVTLATTIVEGEIRYSSVTVLAVSSRVTVGA